ncbi:MAG: GerMN domain-containing protein [bacterium]|nr:GerMN domain-containing protein [bacterium]
MNRRERMLIYILTCILILTAGVFIFIKKTISPKVVFIFLLGYNEETKTTYLTPVKRSISKAGDLETKIKMAIELLLQGPDDSEKQQGLNTAMPENASIINVKVEGGIAFIDFSKEIEQGGGTMLMTDRLAQIVYTATQFPPVEKVRILINGEFIKYFSGEGITDVEKPIGRDNFNYEIKYETGG